MLKSEEGLFVVICGPSCSGKDTLLKELLRNHPEWGRLVNFTTRAPREGEVCGRDYFFVTVDEFQRMRTAGEFLEWNRFDSGLYGSSRVQLEALRAKHAVTLAILDINGVKSAFGVVSPVFLPIFLRVEPSHLRRRLKKRYVADEARITARMKISEEERRRAQSGEFPTAEFVSNNDGKRRKAIREIEELVDRHLGSV